MGDTVAIQEMIVEEMPVRPVTDVMEEVLVNASEPIN